MADYYANGGTAVPGKAKAVGTLTNGVAALISVALIVGVAVWGYRLLVRDVSGVPVVRAIEGPMRVAPDDPGGTTAAHQGLAVNQIAADGSAAAPASRLVLAPAPVALADEDAPRAAPVRDAALTAANPPAPVAAVGTTEQAGMQALVDRLTEGATSLSADTGDADPVVQPVAALASSLVAPARAAGSFGTSLRPMARPANLSTAAARSRPAAAPADAGAAEVTQASANREIDADSIAEGTRLAQLGAFDSPEVARAEWDKLSARFGDFMVGKQRVIQRAESGGRTFYRLRAMGFADLNDARRFCAALVAEKTDCIPVVTR